MKNQTKIKVCGLRRRQDVAYVNAYRPDYIGFILADGFRRQITPEQAKDLADHLDAGIQRVGVFVNQPIAFVSQLLDSGVIQWAQLHGEEDAAYIHALQDVCRRRGNRSGIIKAVRVRTAEDIRRVETYPADYLLLDAWSAKGAGGNGETFDWSLIRELHRPFFLAGGLGPENVAEAIRTVHPYGVDASSSLETQGGKDGNKIRQFITAAREVSAAQE